MILDILSTFSEQQAVTSAAASTNHLDLGEQHEHPGEGRPKYILASVGNTGFTGGSALRITLQDSDDDSTYDALLTYKDVPVADLTAGARVFKIALPAMGVRRYIRLYYESSDTDFTAGTINAALVA